MLAALLAATRRTILRPFLGLPLLAVVLLRLVLLLFWRRLLRTTGSLGAPLLLLIRVVLAVGCIGASLVVLITALFSGLITGLIGIAFAAVA